MEVIVVRVVSSFFFIIIGVCDSHPQICLNSCRKRSCRCRHRCCLALFNGVCAMEVRSGRCIVSKAARPFSARARLVMRFTFVGELYARGCIGCSRCCRRSNANRYNYLDAVPGAWCPWDGSTVAGCFLEPAMATGYGGSRGASVFWLLNESGQLGRRCVEAEHVQSRQKATNRSLRPNYGRAWEIPQQ